MEAILECREAKLPCSNPVGRVFIFSLFYNMCMKKATHSKLQGVWFLIGGIMGVLTGAFLIYSLMQLSVALGVLGAAPGASMMVSALSGYLTLGWIISGVQIVLGLIAIAISTGFFSSRD